MAAPRAGWRELLPGLAPARLVFVDESGAHTRMTRRGGRALGGQRLVAPVGVCHAAMHLRLQHGIVRLDELAGPSAGAAITDPRHPAIGAQTGARGT